jgi:hypothetical protein
MKFLIVISFFLSTNIADACCMCGRDQIYYNSPAAKHLLIGLIIWRLVYLVTQAIKINRNDMKIKGIIARLVFILVLNFGLAWGVGTLLYLIPSFIKAIGMAIYKLKQKKIRKFYWFRPRYT